MNLESTAEQESIREAVTTLCTNFPESYWREPDIDGVFLHDFYQAMVKPAGWACRSGTVRRCRPGRGRRLS